MMSRLFNTTRALVLIASLGIIVGSACAFFLWSLENSTRFFFAHPNLLFALPLAGIGIAWLYERFGAGSEAGNNLLIDAAHSMDCKKQGEDEGADNSPVIPRRMAPLILVGTLITHLFGGSAGREGTAVQMGGALAATLSRFLDLKPLQARTLLLCGLAAGFSGVFGTPFAGAVFALEVLTLGLLSLKRLRINLLFPCLIAALTSNAIVTNWGVGHTHYFIAAPSFNSPTFDLLMAGKIAGAAVAFGLASYLFAEAVHWVSHLAKQSVKNPLLRPFFGGLIIIGLTYALSTRDYLGLGVLSSHEGAITIRSAFRDEGTTPLSWFWKLVFTAVTLGSGFKGGEVTPLFFIGATLGNALSAPLGVPTDLLAGLGFVAVFAGASKTPLACTLLAVELFGATYAPYFALACFVAYACSGRSGIYLSQRIETKDGQFTTLREARQSKWRAKA